MSALYQELNKQNLLTEDTAQIIQVTSQTPHCSIQNVLRPDRSQIWLSQHSLPQIITVQFIQQQSMPVNMVGFDCWHDYASNPKTIELLVSNDDLAYTSWAVLNCDKRAGIQLFQMDTLNTDIQYIQLHVMDTFGANKTYIN
jgi:hypothetical protein